jgi:hypothetical protein
MTMPLFLKARLIAEDYGGNIDIEVGTAAVNFVFRIPAATAASSPMAPEETSAITVNDSGYLENESVDFRKFSPRGSKGQSVYSIVPTKKLNLGRDADMLRAYYYVDTALNYFRAHYGLVPPGRILVAYGSKRDSELRVELKKDPHTRVPDGYAAVLFIPHPALSVRMKKRIWSLEKISHEVVHILMWFDSLYGLLKAGKAHIREIAQDSTLFDHDETIALWTDIEIQAAVLKQEHPFVLQEEDVAFGARAIDLLALKTSFTDQARTPFSILDRNLMATLAALADVARVNGVNIVSRLLYDEQSIREIRQRRFVTVEDFMGLMLQTDNRIFGGKYREAIRTSFRERGLSVSSPVSTGKLEKVADNLRIKLSLEKYGLLEYLKRGTLMPGHMLISPFDVFRYGYTDCNGQAYHVIQELDHQGIPLEGIHVWFVNLPFLSPDGYRDTGDHAFVVVKQQNNNFILGFTPYEHMLFGRVGLFTESEYRRKINFEITLDQSVSEFKQLHERGSPSGLLEYDAARDKISIRAVSHDELMQGVKATQAIPIIGEPFLARGYTVPIAVINSSVLIRAALHIQEHFEFHIAFLQLKHNEQDRSFGDVDLHSVTVLVARRNLAVLQDFVREQKNLTDICSILEKSDLYSQGIITIRKKALFREDPDFKSFCEQNTEALAYLVTQLDLLQHPIQTVMNLAHQAGLIKQEKKFFASSPARNALLAERTRDRIRKRIALLDNYSCPLSEKGKNAILAIKAALEKQDTRHIVLKHFLHDLKNPPYDWFRQYSEGINGPGQIWSLFTAVLERNLVVNVTQDCSIRCDFCHLEADDFVRRMPWPWVVEIAEAVNKLRAGQFILYLWLYFNSDPLMDYYDPVYDKNFYDVVSLFTGYFQVFTSGVELGTPSARAARKFARDERFSAESKKGHNPVRLSLVTDSKWVRRIGDKAYVKNIAWFLRLFGGRIDEIIKRPLLGENDERFNRMMREIKKRLPVRLKQVMEDKTHPSQALMNDGRVALLVDKLVGKVPPEHFRDRHHRQFNDVLQARMLFDPTGTIYFVTPAKDKNFNWKVCRVHPALAELLSGKPEVTAEDIISAGKKLNIQYHAIKNARELQSLVRYFATSAASSPAQNVSIVAKDKPSLLVVSREPVTSSSVVDIDSSAAVSPSHPKGMFAMAVILLLASAGLSYRAPPALITNDVLPPPFVLLNATGDSNPFSNQREIKLSKKAKYLLEFFTGEAWNLLISLAPIPKDSSGRFIIPPELYRFLGQEGKRGTLTSHNDPLRKPLGDELTRLFHVYDTSIDDQLIGMLELLIDESQRLNEEGTRKKVEDTWNKFNNKYLQKYLRPQDIRVVFTIVNESGRWHYRFEIYRVSKDGSLTPLERAAVSPLAESSLTAARPSLSLRASSPTQNSRLGRSPALALVRGQSFVSAQDSFRSFRTTSSARQQEFLGSSPATMAIKKNITKFTIAELAQVSRQLWLDNEIYNLLRAMNTDRGRDEHLRSVAAQRVQKQVGHMRFSELFVFREAMLSVGEVAVCDVRGDNLLMLWLSYIQERLDERLQDLQHKEEITQEQLDRLKGLFVAFAHINAQLLSLAWPMYLKLEFELRDEGNRGVIIVRLPLLPRDLRDSTALNGSAFRIVLEYNFAIRKPFVWHWRLRSLKKPSFMHRHVEVVYETFTPADGVLSTGKDGSSPLVHGNRGSQSRLFIASSPASMNDRLNKFVRKAKRGSKIIMELEVDLLQDEAVQDILLSGKNVISIAHRPNTLQYAFRKEGEDIGHKLFIGQGFVFIAHTHPAERYGILTFFLPSFIDLQSSRGHRYFVLSRRGIAWYKVDEGTAEVIDQQEYKDYLVSAETGRKDSGTIKKEFQERFGVELDFQLRKASSPAASASNAVLSRIVVSESGLNKIFFEKSRKVARRLNEMLGEPHIVSQPLSKNGVTVDFFPQRIWTCRKWTFSSSDIAKVAILIYSIPYEAVRDYDAKREVAVSEDSLPKVFWGSGSALLRRFNELLDKVPQDTDGSKILRKGFLGVRLVRRSRRVHLSWVFPRTNSDIAAVSEILGVAVRPRLEAIKPWEVPLSRNRLEPIFKVYNLYTRTMVARLLGLINRAREESDGSKVIHRNDASVRFRKRMVGKHIRWVFRICESASLAMIAAVSLRQQPSIVPASKNGLGRFFVGNPTRLAKELNARLSCLPFQPDGSKIMKRGKVAVHFEKNIFHWITAWAFPSADIEALAYITKFTLRKKSISEEEFINSRLFDWQIKALRFLGLNEMAESSMKAYLVEYYEIEKELILGYLYAHRRTVSADEILIELHDSLLLMTGVDEIETFIEIMIFQHNLHIASSPLASDQKRVALGASSHRPSSSPIRKERESPHDCEIREHLTELMKLSKRELAELALDVMVDLPYFAYRTYYWLLLKTHKYHSAFGNRTVFLKKVNKNGRNGFELHIATDRNIWHLIRGMRELKDGLPELIKGGAGFLTGITPNDALLKLIEKIAKRYRLEISRENSQPTRFQRFLYYLGVIFSFHPKAERWQRVTLSLSNSSQTGIVPSPQVQEKKSGAEIEVLQQQLAAVTERLDHDRQKEIEYNRELRQLESAQKKDEKTLRRIATVQEHLANAQRSARIEEGRQGAILLGINEILTRYPQFMQPLGETYQHYLRIRQSVVVARMRQFSRSALSQADQEFIKDMLRQDQGGKGKLPLEQIKRLEVIIAQTTLPASSACGKRRQLANFCGVDLETIGGVSPRKAAVRRLYR